ncbi:MAG TPA: hypothetical protein VK469_13700 [Candidatus Kapabacteria bacterium]|nr:hypothetical protein [Candidatus Kapabacteria bacterium]
MNIVIEKLNEVLTALPGAVLPSNCIGAKKPSDTNEIPAVIMSINIVGSEGIGIGVTRRDEIMGERYHGAVALEIWAGSADKAAEISQKLQNKIRSDRMTLRKKGFLKFTPEYLEPLENIKIDPPDGSPFSVWKQKLGYKFVFEAEEGGELSSGTVIKRIALDVNQNPDESFSVPN